VPEALRTRVTDPDSAGGRQEHGAPPAKSADQERERQGQERDCEPEDDFGDSWRTYRERIEHVRQTSGWTVQQAPPRAENWLPLGGDDQEYDQPPDPVAPLAGEERDREDR
jgi:hypothetical protein